MDRLLFYPMPFVLFFLPPLPRYACLAKRLSSQQSRVQGHDTGEGQDSQSRQLLLPWIADVSSALARSTNPKAAGG